VVVVVVCKWCSLVVAGVVVAVVVPLVRCWYLWWW
jgi:hypothetical protein